MNRDDAQATLLLIDCGDDIDRLIDACDDPDAGNHNYVAFHMILGQCSDSGMDYIRSCIVDWQTGKLIALAAKDIIANRRKLLDVELDPHVTSDDQ